MDEDIAKLKPYLSNLRRSIAELRPEIRKLTKNSLDDQLIQYPKEQQRLELCNTYSYVLNSLVFSYMKLINVKDMSNIMVELNRCKEYMKKANDLKVKLDKKSEGEERRKENAKNAIIGALNGPSISKENFKKQDPESTKFVGKHTKFDTQDKTTIGESLKDRIIDKKKKNTGKISKN
ncbi:Lrp1p KNAG_0B04470 [Huiozyma naganishii CBS 8797]|uniref:Exosome complex protein n=1 Tax=Huiozyma naganishii (strain ATCC MYA-139 / BCRC 22969 / CBS 8797 / KCTC 17520 / NBRC 10181 / NCYC 3082 / Yp74L-3) TaxID=1071383 RepID=J7S4Y6_HUIN7|nr:hypothetical protein KNAG_0B04470 [Kazachstania naganishii CBS 8797]CCK68881.1 hypothetical protein KNAG_0B04470 [Kazachstania naganishii CBS 8797]